VVVVSSRPEIPTAVGRLAALAGAELAVVAAPDRLRAAWHTATAVVVGIDLLDAVAAASLPRRDRVIVVGLAPASEVVWRAAMSIGAVGVAVLPDDDREVVELLSDDRGSRAAASVLGVIGGCGGAGASTLAAALGLHSARTTATLLVDADPLGGGLDVLLGAERMPGLRWSDVADARGRLDAKALADALPVVAGCAVVSHGRGSPASVAADAASAVLDAGVRGFGQVVIDLPRCGSPAGATLIAGCDRVALVVPATVRATAAASVVVRELLAGCGDRVRLVVRDPGGDRLSVADVTRALDRPAIGTVCTESALAAAANRGEPPRLRRGSVAAVCRAVLADPAPMLGAA
jgi:secretion/DNA translocation related CpaE-like protein